MSKEFVTFNGVQMAKSWPENIEESQLKTTYIIDDQDWPRVRYGDESDDWGADRRPCHDCGVVKGQYHVPFLCDVERCPICDGQVISCDCNYEDDAKE